MLHKFWQLETFFFLTKSHFSFFLCLSIFLSSTHHLSAEFEEALLRFCLEAKREWGEKERSFGHWFIFFFKSNGIGMPVMGSHRSEDAWGDGERILVHENVTVTVHLSVCLSVCSLSVCSLSVCLSVLCLSICLSVYFSAYRFLLPGSLWLLST